MELFNRGPSIALRFVVLAVLSIVIMLIDHNDNRLDRSRVYLSAVAAPLQYAVDLPSEASHWMQENFTTRETLLADNAILRRNQQLLQARLLKFTSIQKENERLLALLKAAQTVSDRYMLARLLAVNSDPYVHQVTIARGSRDGVFEGQPVIDAQGVLGQVIQVGLSTSQVLLLSDTRSAIPVEDTRNGMRAIVMGTGVFGNLAVANIPKTESLIRGDLLVTSGLDQRYPAGYPVGIVSSVQQLSGEHFATIDVTPSADINKSRLVLLVWPKSTPNVATKGTSSVASKSSSNVVTKK